MRRKFISFFKRDPLLAFDTDGPEADSPPPVDPKTPVSLPATVRDAIDAANIVVQFSAQHDEPRVLFNLPGYNPTVYSDEGVRKIFENIFPELSERQLDKVLKRVDFRIVSAAQAKFNSVMERQTYSARVGGVNWDDDFRNGRW
ncbi:hypothetical protein [Croceicoccus mobilis]|uniref:Uncharacterized protein n=1 Tax=Croceicoccus mobilis TaxID=1703339 RepID=A0A916Z4T7_9SPHN|nr:hypothetical protein [Croceicoccus mobilis]GGD76799.1 hypothetical protein GCM10010990_28150 [Croceicoccus mobilis]